MDDRFIPRIDDFILKSNAETEKEKLIKLGEVMIGQTGKKTVTYVYPDGEHHCVNAGDFINSKMDKNVFISCLIASLARSCNLLDVGETGFRLLMLQCQKTAENAYKNKKEKK